MPKKLEDSLGQPEANGLTAPDSPDSLAKWQEAAKQMLSHLEARGMITRTTAREYHDAIASEKNADGMKAFYEWMKQGVEKAETELGTLETEIDHAVRSKIMSAKDRDFLMSHLILTDGHDFVGQNEMRTIARLLREKITRMKKDRENYDAMANHPLIKKTGGLTIGKGVEIKFPDESAFLAMSTPDRRKLLENLQKHLPKAETYARTIEAKESARLDKVYGALLTRAIADKIIGNKTAQKFADEFKALDIETKEYWVEEFESQMGRYRTLWKEIRSTLKDVALTHMESLRHQMGYTELLNHFGQLQEAESRRLTAEYANQLKQYQKEGLIGKHTVDSFLGEFDHLELADRYTWMAKLHQEMQKYRTLAGQEATLNKKELSVLRDHFDEWGYTERASFVANPQYAMQKIGTVSDAAEEALNVISDRTKRAAILETKENLEQRGSAQKRTFIDRVWSLFESKSGEDTMTDFNNRLKKERAKQRQGDGLPGGETIREADGFHEAEFVDSEGNESRIVHVDINESEGLDAFLSEENKRNFHSKDAGGHDEIALSIRRDDDTSVSLKVTEIRAMNQYFNALEEDEKLDRAA